MKGNSKSNAVFGGAGTERRGDARMTTPVAAKQVEEGVCKRRLNRSHVRQQAQDNKPSCLLGKCKSDEAVVSNDAGTVRKKNKENRVLGGLLK